MSVDLDELKASVTKATHSPAAANAVKRLRLGIRTQDADAWIPLGAWDGCKAAIDWDKFAGAPCCAGLDLASSSDFAAEALCFPIDADLSPAKEFDRPWGYAFKWRLWMPKGYVHPAEKRLRELVAPWVPTWVEHTEGDVIDHDVIESAVRADAELYDLRLLHYDPWNATQLAVRLQDRLQKVEQFPQNMSRFAEPTKRFGEAISSGRLRHDGSPAVRWMANNVVTVQNAASHMMPSRKKSRNKIDGIVAGVMSLGACLATPAPSYIGSLLVM